MSQFKKFLTHLQKKDEEITLNKKRKKEEGKQKTKSDKLRNQTRIPSQNYTNINLSQIPLYSQMDIYNNRNYLNQRGCRGNPMYAQQGYQFPQGTDQRFLVNGNVSGDYKGEYPCAQMELKETINVQYMERCFKREIVNHIVGALYIQQAINKSNEQKKMMANGEDEQTKMQLQQKEENLFQQINNDTHNESNLHNNDRQEEENKEQNKESEHSNDKNEEDSHTQQNNNDIMINENNNEGSYENENRDAGVPNLTCW